MGCNNGKCNIEMATLPMLSGCPEDNEWFLVGNATGGFGQYRYARRRWADLKNCIGGKKPLIAIVGRGGENDPEADSTVWQSDLLKGLGSTNNNKIQIFIDDVPQSNFGVDTSFYYDPVAGTIDIDNGTGNRYINESGIYVDLNQ